jgi:DNA-binding SARP family transcriptional activator
MWSLVTLGSLRLIDLRTGDECLRGRRKELVLLAFLARRAPRLVPRSVLAELLWGDKDEDRARASLRQALSRLRGTLGEALDVQTDHVSLSTEAVTLDVRTLEETAAAGRWSSVAAQWGGSFLAGHDDVGDESFREWVDGERARLARIMERAFALLLEDAEQRGELKDAIAIAHRWHDAFPDDENANDGLTRALKASRAANPDAHEHIAPRVAGVAPPLPVTAAPPDRLHRFTAGPARWIAFGVGLIAVVAAAISLARQSFARAGAAPLNDVETVIVPDFRAVGVDTMLAQVISEALRIDIRQSRSLSVYSSAAVQRALQRLDPTGATKMNLETARRIAARSGIKVVADGEMVGIGSSYLISVRLIATTSGAELVHFSAPAADSNNLLLAVDVLAANLRRAAGETVRNVENARPVERVTTESLEALGKYVRATRALDVEGALGKGLTLLDEAIALDSTFAMAYRRLAIELNDRGGNDARVRGLIERAYAHRARLTDQERYAVEAAYHSFGPAPDEDKAIAAYEAALEANPRFGVPLVNLSGIFLRRHQFARAESLAQRAVALNSTSIAAHANLAQAQTNLGKLDAAAATIAHLDSVSPGIPAVFHQGARLLNARGAPDSAATLVSKAFESTTDIARRQLAAGLLRDLALARGHVADGRRWAAIWTDMAKKRNQPAAALAGALDQAWITLWFDRDTSAALREVASALKQYPLDSIPPLDRPYGKLIRLFAWAGRPARARIALAGYDSAIGPRPRNNIRALGPRYRGQIALAERRYDDAMAYFRAADSVECATCLLPFMAITYDRMGVRDSARALWRRYAGTPDYERIESDASFRQLALQEQPLNDFARDRAAVRRR